MRKLKLISAALFAMQMALSVVFSIYILRLNVLPDRTNALCIAFLALALLLSAIMLIGKTKPRQILCAFISSILCIIMVFPIKIMKHTDYTLKNLQGEAVGYHTGYEILVRKDDSAQILNDISTYKFGIDTSYDRKSANEALKSISHKLGDMALYYEEYSSSAKLWSALVETKVVDVVLMESNFYEMFKESYASQNDSIENYVKKIENITVAIDVEKPEEEKDEENADAPQDPPKPLNERPFVIYVSGIDVAGKITMRSRSDVNILIVINPITKKMILVTVPRDTYVPFPGVTNGEYDKLTHAGIYGNNCSVSIATLEQYIYTGINIDRWIRVNFTSVERIVDALGGITVESQYDFSFHHSTFVKGKNYLNGRQALDFSRNRMSFAQGDMQRGRNQLEVIKGIFAKAISPAILPAYSDILNEIMDCVQTNLSYEDSTGLVKMQLSDGASWDIETASIYVEYKDDYCYSLGSANCVGVMSEKSRLEVLGKINAVIEGR